MAAFTLSPLLIDQSRIAAICEEEWQSFLEDMQITPVPERQDLRGFFLNWVAVFLPDAFPTSLQSEMSAWMAPQLDTRDSTWGYVRPALIGSTLFALSGNSGWLQVQFDNFADGGSQVRSFFHRSLALVAPKITFDSGLLRRLDFGMKHVYFFMDIPLALYAVSQGRTNEKLESLKRWQAGFMNPAEKEAVEGYLKGSLVDNPLQHCVSEKMSYVALRIASFPITAPRDIGLPLGIALSPVWESMQQHPLFSSHIELHRDATGATPEE